MTTDKEIMQKKPSNWNTKSSQPELSSLLYTKYIIKHYNNFNSLRIYLFSCFIHLTSLADNQIKYTKLFNSSSVQHHYLHIFFKGFFVKTLYWTEV